MAKRNRQTSKKRDREMAKRQKKQDKADRTAARRSDRPSGVDPQGEPASPEADPDRPRTARPVLFDRLPRCDSVSGGPDAETS